MSTFEGVYQDDVVGSVTMFDRMIFRGYLRTLYSPEASRCFLFNQGVLLKDFKPYVQQATATLKTHAQRTAAEAPGPISICNRPPPSGTAVPRKRSRAASPSATRHPRAGVRAGDPGAVHVSHPAPRP